MSKPPFIPVYILIEAAKKLKYTHPHLSETQRYDIASVVLMETAGLIIEANKEK